MRTWSFQVAGDSTPPVLGGRLCLAFVNSVLWRRSTQPRDLINDYAELVDYLCQACLVGEDERSGLKAAAVHRPAQAQGVHAVAIALREALYQVLSAAAAGARPAEPDLRVLTGTLHDGMRHLELIADPAASAADGVRAVWAADHLLEWPLWEIAASATAVLLADEPGRLKQCPGDQCGWLFTDRSRNRSRRWCTSTMCGNRERARRHYQRRH